MRPWKRGDPSNTSEKVLVEMGSRGKFPTTVPAKNESIGEVAHTLPGVFTIRAVNAAESPLVITGGLHGDEKAGIAILDLLTHAILAGTLPVRRNLLLMYGNLEAMKANGGKGARCIEPEMGATSNLNRCFGRGKFSAPRCYAERRANQMMDAAKRFVTAYGRPEAIDIHQSFAVPSVNEVRGITGRPSAYTYAMLYPVQGGLENTLRWIFEGYSDIVAGAVLNDMSQKHNTFAGFMAREYGSNAATFEQGTIGYVDYDTFTPQLLENLARKIGGETKLANPLGFDVWRYIRSVTKRSDAFHFVEPDGRKAERAPLDFVQRPAGIFARDGDTTHALEADQRILFANADVPIGDRAAAVIERHATTLVPAP